VLVKRPAGPLFRRLSLAAISAITLSFPVAAAPAAQAVQALGLHPLVSDAQWISSDANPPADAACNAVGLRCFNPTAMANSYNYAGLHASGIDGRGKTIAIIDSFGASTIRQDLGTFNTAFGLTHLCGETGPSDPSANCDSSVSPRFDIIQFQGGPAPTPPPPSSGTGQEAHNLWALEVALDVEWAHATAPMANIMLVTTPTAETLGVQGFQQMMNAEQYIADHHMADVITQSFGSGEGAFHDGLASLKQLRQAFVDAQANKITVFASSGDGGTSNNYKEPVKNPAQIPYQSVIWPASDPLVTAVGGTYLCTDATTGTFVNTVEPPVSCHGFRNPDSFRETGWVASGGGYSIYFQRPDFQAVLPPGSSYLGCSAGAPNQASCPMRGIPDIAYQASSLTGVLVRLTEPTDTSGQTGCGGANPCVTGWYVVGGTSSGSPQWAGIAAMADQVAGRDLGYINPSLYKMANDPLIYARDFYDEHWRVNQTTSIPGYPSTTGWDAVTGLGSPNVANLIPDLIAATP
jgi:subtilase family serine protease